jgi:TRAP transporter 4TM/12TM fusion protein
MKSSEVVPVKATLVEEPSLTVDGTKYETLPLIARAIFLVLASVVIASGVVYVFKIDVGSFVLYDLAFFYLVIACVVSMVFFILPAKSGDVGMPWYDWILAALALGIGLYFCYNSWDIRLYGWANPEGINVIFGGIYCLLLIECGRRTGGMAYVSILLLMLLYPLFADKLPGLLYGMNYPVDEIIGKNMFGSDGILGMPASITGEILVGFLLFGGVIISSGAGKFFLDISLSIVGPFRGGPAKVSAVSSGFYGSISGGSFGNIVATGSFTIPAMRKTGYPGHYAGAVEALSSNASAITPPVMGALSFIMAAFLGVDYSVIVIASAIPALLYYFSIIMHVDAYAARHGIVGIPREDCPKFWKTLAGGWQFILVALFLVYGLAYMQWGVRSAYYATALMFFLSFTTKTAKMTPKNIILAIASVGQLLCRVCPVILGATFILVALISTGMAAALTAAIINASGDNYIVLLLAGMLLCYLLGMIGLIITPYIFLSVSMIPAVVGISGIDPLPVHMFVIYYMMFSAITLPVAPAAFLAAALSGASPIKTALTCMKLAAVVYFIPFFFVFNPALLMQGSHWESLYLTIFCLIGITFIAAGAEGYLLKVGTLVWPERILCIIGGFLFAVPITKLSIIGACIVLPTVVVAKRRHKKVESLKSNLGSAPQT